MRTLRTCSTPRCPNLVVAGRCDHCRARAPRTRAKTAERGYSGYHVHWRRDVLLRDPVCQRCHVKPSTDAHHIVDVVDGGEWTMENGQGLCHECHSSVTNGRPA